MKDGAEQGKLDAMANVDRRPRPELGLSILSSGYRDAYLKAYRRSYDLQSRVQRELSFRSDLEEQRAQSLIQQRSQNQQKSQGQRPR